MKAVQPLFETAVIGVDVLDMDGAIDAHACVEIDRLVREVRVLRKAAVGPVACRSPGAHPWPARAAVRQPARLLSSVRLLPNQFQLGADT